MRRETNGRRERGRRAKESGATALLVEYCGRIDRDRDRERVGFIP